VSPKTPQQVLGTPMMGPSHPLATGQLGTHALGPAQVSPGGTPVLGWDVAALPPTASFVLCSHQMHGATCLGACQTVATSAEVSCKSCKS
jgi:hypothetical protein